MSLSNSDRIREYLVGCRADQFGFLKSLVSVPSENPPGDGAAIRARVIELLVAFDLVADVLDVPDEAAAAAGYEDHANLVVRRVFGDGPVVVLSAHLDTAPAGDNWQHNPFGAEIIDGRMYGRGVSDGKGDLAAYLFALRALAEVADDLQGSVELHLTFDEVAGGELGAKWILAAMADKPALAIVPGVARAMGTESTAVLNLAVEIQGRAAPAGQPRSGADALEATAPVLAALYAYRDGLNEIISETPGIGAPTMVVTEISGGDSPLTVPDRVSLSIDRRILPEESADNVEAEMTNIIGRSVAQVPGVICKVRRHRFLPGMKSGEMSRDLIQTMGGHLEALLGEAPATYGVARETVARHYTAAGVPAILYGAGPSFDNAANPAGPDESLALDDLRISTEVIALALAEWLKASPIVSTGDDLKIDDGQEDGDTPSDMDVPA